MARADRPLSPHLQIYRWYFTMALSIAHRATGIALAAGLILLTWWLLALAHGPEAFAVAQGVTRSWFGVLVLFLYTLALFYHMGNGVRHLVWDFGYGFDPEVARLSGIAVLVFAAATTTVTWLGVSTVVNGPLDFVPGKARPMEFLKSWWDVISFTLLCLLHIAAWVEDRVKIARVDSKGDDFRYFAADSLIKSASAGIYAVSILLSASMIILQVSSGSDSNKDVLEALFRSGVWFLASLTLGLFCIYIAAMRYQERNVISYLLVGIIFAPQLFALVIGAIWFLVSLSKAM